MPIGTRRPWLVALGAAAMVAAAVASSMAEQAPAAPPADRPAYLGLHVVDVAGKPAPPATGDDEKGGTSAP